MIKNKIQNTANKYCIFIAVWIIMLVAVYIFNSPAIPLYNKNISVGIIATGEKN